MKLLELVRGYESEHGFMSGAVRASQGSGGQLHFYDKDGNEVGRSEPTEMASDWNGASVVYCLNPITHRHCWCYHPADAYREPVSAPVAIDDELLNEVGEICIVLPRNNVYNRTQKTLFICDPTWLAKQLADGKWKRAIG